MPDENLGHPLFQLKIMDVHIFLELRMLNLFNDTLSRIPKAEIQFYAYNVTSAEVNGPTLLNQILNKTGRDGLDKMFDGRTTMKHSLSALLATLLLMLPAYSQSIEKQQAMNWCWAACIQDVMAEAGIYLTQSQIAARLTGWAQDAPASIQQIVVILRSYNFQAWQAGASGTPQQLYGTLSTGWKLIAFVRPTNGPVGHYIVLEGIDPGSGGVIVGDPYTGQTQVYSLAQLYYAWRWFDSVVVGKPIRRIN